MKLLNGNKISREIFRQLKIEITSILKQGLRPRVAVALVGDDPAALAYIAAKRKKAKDLGIEFEVQNFPNDISQDELCRAIVEINRLPGICGIIVQLPLPKKFDKQRVLDCVLPSLDIDGLSSANQARLFAGGKAYIPPAPSAVLEIIRRAKINLNDKHVLIVGAGDLVGKPLSRLLMQQDTPVSIVTEKTREAHKLMKNADIIVSAVGKPNIITGDMIKKGVVIIDAGTSFALKSGKVRMSGDVDFDSVKSKVSHITPVPGGVGPVTVAMLYKNIVDSCQKILHN